MEVRLALSKKQHTSLRRGRKVRVSHKHMDGSGARYVVHPRTHEKLRRAFEHECGCDLQLEPAEIEASMHGGSLGNKLKQGQKVLDFMGKTYKAVAHEVAPVTRPIFDALSQAAVTKINNAANPTAQYTTAASQAADVLNGILNKPATQPVAEGQTIDYVGQAAAAAAIANSFNPYRAPEPPLAPAAFIGTYTAPAAPTLLPGFHTAASEAMYGEGFRHLIGRGQVHAPTKLFHRQHAALVSDPYSVSFMQQLPGVFKDSARLAAGRGLVL